MEGQIMDKSSYVLDIKVEGKNEKEAIDKAIRYLAERSQRYKADGHKAPTAPASPPFKNSVENGHPKGDEAYIAQAEAKLREVCDEAGRDVAFEVLKSFGVKRISDFPRGKIGEFMVACDKALRGE